MQKQIYVSKNKKIKSNGELLIRDKNEKTKTTKEQKNSTKNIENRDKKHKNNSSVKNSIKVFLANIITKSNFIYFILALIDIILIIYFARSNVVNYVEVIGEEIFVSKTRYLLLGRNYIALIVTFFFFVYTLALQHFFFHKKLTRKYLLITFFFYFILNVMLFYLFTKRIY